MFSHSLAVGALAVGCVAAAAGGAYLAVRHNADVAQPVASAAASPNPEGQPADTPRAVAETEALVATPEAVSVKPAVEPEPAVRQPSSPATARSDKAPRSNRQTGRAAPSRTATVNSGSSTPAAQEPVRDPAVTTSARETPAEAPVVTAPVSARTDVDGSGRPETPAPPPPQFEQLVVPESSVVGLRVETPLTTERARIEDRVDARVTRDVIADGRVAIPAGARAIGSVTLVERGGKVKERARLGVRFHTLVLADGTELPISTDAILREGESPAGESTRKIGGAAIGGAILGALIGGKKGAVVGSATGAAGGTAVVMAGDRNAATLPSGTVVTIRLAAPVAVEVEKR